MSDLNRRRVLRGILNGGAVTVALPLLNCFLNDNGTALASGAPLPVRFGTWFWGCGMNAKAFVPKKVGAGFDLPEEIAALKPIRDYINIFTNFNVFRDALPNFCHNTGWKTLMSGIAPVTRADRPGETMDVTISRLIGRSTRFQSLTATATGDVRSSITYENVNSPNAAEWSAMNFYTRLFGADFQDPNAPTFTPSPRVMVRKSVLSGVMEDARALQQKVGAEDKTRLDQYFTGLRALEHQFDQQLTKPEPIAACHRVAAPREEPKQGSDSVLTEIRHRMLTDLLVMAVACDQTRVFNMSYAAAEFPNTSKAGYEKPHHTTTHEEPVDETLGYQPTVSWFTQRAMESWAYFVEAFSRVKEGDTTLLDNVLIFALSDHGLAKNHSLDGIPMFTAGRGGRRVKTGIHVDGGGGAGTRVGYTAMRVMGVDKASWGSASNKTSQEISEILI
jgi:hypothetical protein